MEAEIKEFILELGVDDVGFSTVTEYKNFIHHTPHQMHIFIGNLHKARPGFVQQLPRHQ